MSHATLWLCALATFGGIRAADGAPNFEWPDWQRLRASYPAAPAVFLLDDMASEVGYVGGDEYGRRVEVHQVIAILDPQRASEWLDWDVPDYDGHRVSHLEARTWLSATQSRKVEKNDFHDVQMFPDAVLFADIRGRRFAFPAVTQNSVIEVSYDYNSPSVYSYDRHLFAHTIPTLLSRARFVVPVAFLQEEFNQAVRAIGVPNTPKVQVLPREAGDVREFAWEMRDQPAIAYEPGMPPLSEVAPSISLAPRAPDREGWGWAVVGRRYWEGLLRSQLRGSPQIHETAQRLTEGLSSPAERIKALYGYVQREIRYVAVELGIGGFQPHPAPQVLQMRYGDCKDKACLLLSLMHEVGIEGSAALVRTRGAGVVDTGLVHLGQFDHMIVSVPMNGEPWWLDPTAEYCAPDYLPAMDQGTLALVLGPGGGHFEFTPAFEPEASVMDRRVFAELMSNGDLEGTLEIRAHGEVEMAWRGAFRTRATADQNQLAARTLTDAMPGAHFKAFHVMGVESAASPLVIAIDFTCPHCASATGDLLLLPGGFLASPDWPQPLNQENRVHTVCFDVLEQIHDRVRIRPPAGFAFEAPGGASAQGSCFSYARESHADSGAVVLERDARLMRFRITPPNFSLARREAEALDAAFTTPLTFRRNP